MNGTTSRPLSRRALWVGLGTGLVLVLISRWMSLPRTPWEYDELLFTQAVVHFDPIAHHPHPPGYPLLVGLGKAVNAVVGDPFRSLLGLSLFANLVGFVALFLTFHNIAEGQLNSPGGGGEHSGISANRVYLALTGALLFFFSPAMLVHSGLALSDPPALMFVMLALWSISEESLHRSWWGGALLGAFSSAAIGCRPQYAIAVLPMLLLGVLFLREYTRRLVAVGAFTTVSLAWFVPLVVTLGGIGEFIAYQTKQAAFLAGQDAGLARATRTVSEVVLRFVAHPWGTKWLSLPVLALAALGAFLGIRGKNRALLPIGVLGVVHLVFCLGFCDPADGVRYALPALLLIALMASQALAWGLGLIKFPAWISLVGMAVFVVAASAYVWPIAWTRSHIASPPVHAADFVRQNLKQGTVLFEPPLLPHAQWLLAGIRTRPVAEDWQVAVEQPGAKVVLFADRLSTTPGARVFEWPACDAYGKLTRNHYRVVSVIPLRTEEMFRPVQGFYPLESYIDGTAWRWLGPTALLEATGACSHLRLTLELDKHAPYPTNAVHVESSEKPGAAYEFLRGEPKTIEVPCTAGNLQRLTIRSEKTYVPRDAGLGLDPRTLAIKLLAFERVGP